MKEALVSRIKAIDAEIKSIREFLEQDTHYFQQTLKKVKLEDLLREKERILHSAKIMDLDLQKEA